MTQSTDRLDRIEQLLAQVAESNAASAQRLDRVEANLARTEESQARTQIIVEQNAAGLRETRAIADSNARAIEAWSSRIEEGIAEAEEVSSSMTANTNRRMEEAIADTVQMIANLGQQQQASMERAEQADQRFEVFLQDARADRKRFDEGLARADRDRALNESEHRAFRETFQTMLAQIAQLWQRVAG